MKGCCAEQASCCCGGTPCSTPCFPPVKESTSTRLLYIILFTCGAVLCCAVVSQRVADELPQYPRVAEFCNTTLLIGDNCGKLVGYMAVYRICFAMAAFFLIFTVLTIGTKSSKSCMAYMHNGIWLFKVLGLLGLLVTMWFVPAIHLVLEIALYVGFTGAALFIFMQLWLLIDFASSWNSKWSDSASSNKCWYFALTVFTLVFFFIAGGLTWVCARLFAAHLDCIQNIYFIGASFFLCIIITFFTFVTCFQKESPDNRGGLLQASIVSAYVMYLTWSALLVEPDIYVPAVNRTIASQPNMTKAICGPISVTSSSLMEGTNGELNNAVFAALLMLGMVLYACCWIGMHSRSRRKEMSAESRSSNTTTRETGFWCCASQDEESQDDVEVRRRGWGLIRNEKNGTVYNYALFHLTFVLASFYIMMTLTNWYQPEEAALESLNRTWPPFWVRLGSAWLCGVLYVLKLMFVVCCESRNRSDYQQTATR